MAKTTDLPFNGGAIVVPSGETATAQVHTVFLREITIIDSGRESRVYALFDMNKPTTTAPFFEPVSAFNLAEWCVRGDVVLVDVAEALETGTNTYSAFFESANVETNSDGPYIRECVIRVDTKLSGTTPKINTRYIHLSQTLDESTGVAYLCQPTTLNDHIVYGDSLKRIGKVHFLKAVYNSQADVSAPYGYWIVDLEKPNANSPYGYDYAMADEIIAKLSAGEIFVLSTYSTAPSPEEDLYIMSASALQSREGHEAVRIWFTEMFAAGRPESMYFTTIYTPSMYNDDPDNNYPEGRMAILNWRGQQDSRSEFKFMPYTELAEVATSGDYDDLSNKPSIPDAPVQSDWNEADTSSLAFIKNKPNLALKEDASNKVSEIDPTSTTQYPSCMAVANFCNAITDFISRRAVYWNNASSYNGGSANRYFKLATISSEALQNNVNNVWRTIVSTDSVIEVAYLRLKVRLNATGDQPVGNLNVSPIGIWSNAVTFSVVLRGTVGNVTIELWVHHEGGYRSTVISDMGGGSFNITSKDKSNWTYTSYNNDGSASIPTDASTQVIDAVVDP